MPISLTPLSISPITPLADEKSKFSPDFTQAREEVRKLFAAKQATQRIFGSNVENDDEENLRFLEEQIPELASAILKQSYKNALASGATVLEAVDGALVETAADGSRQLIHALPPSFPASIGSRRVRRAS